MKYTVSFTPQTKTTLDGLQPKFSNDDKILVSNGQDGTFASANICMAENIITEAEFRNKRACSASTITLPSLTTSSVTTAGPFAPSQNNKDFTFPKAVRPQER